MQHTQDLTQGSITRRLWLFALPMIAGNMLQQLYNVADTLIVGRYIGADALAAVGSSYTLMTFLTSIILGLSMGSGAVFSIRFGEKDETSLRRSIFLSFLFIGIVTVGLNLIIFWQIDTILWLLRIPQSLFRLTREYLWVIFWGLSATFLYNFFASLLRAIGNSTAPLIFLAVSALLNIVLDLVFVLEFRWGVAGAAVATVISQYISGIGIFIYTFIRMRNFLPSKKDMHWNFPILREIAGSSFLTCIQQSIMNLGILMVQGLVNSFGAVVMAAFAAAVKIDSLAYLPVQDFGNAFSTFIAQNYGAGNRERISRGIRSAILTSVVFSVVLSMIICIFARPLMHIFVLPEEIQIVSIGVGYLRIEGACYAGIGILFLLYGLYRGISRPAMSVVLTVISLGTRVALAYILSAIPAIGITGIWVSVPIGWFLADAAGILYYRLRVSTFLRR